MVERKNKNRRLTDYMLGKDRVEKGARPSEDMPVEVQRAEGALQLKESLFDLERAPWAPPERKSRAETENDERRGASASKDELSGGGASSRVTEEQVYLWFFREDEAYIKGVLISSYYDPEKNRAVLAFIDDKSAVRYWYDKKGHRPYFIVKDDPGDVIKRIPPSVNDKVVNVESIVKHNALYNRKERYTKITVADPLSVRELRKHFDMTWESNIKYHQNYVYDNQLVPGLSYIVDGASLSPLGKEEDYASYIPSSFIEPSLRPLAKHFIQVLEEPAQVPPMMALDVEVYSPVLNRMPDPKKAIYPILSVAVVTSDGNREVHVALYPRMGSRKQKEGERGYRLIIHDSEIGLLQSVFSLISKYPVVVTYNGDNFDLPYLRNRAIALGFRELEIPIVQEQDYFTFKGAIHIDLYHVFENRSIKVYVYGGTYRENTLDAVASAILGIGKLKLELPVSMLNLEDLVEYNLRDAEITFKLIEWKNYTLWKLLIALSRLSKTGIEDLTRTQISNWIRNTLYWEHRKRGMIIPSKEELQRLKGEARSKAIIKGKKYMGAVVLDPPVGVFFNIAVLDFASLYPSIMKIWNLSYETVNPLFPCKNLMTVPEVGHQVCFDHPGITAQIISLLRDLRVRVYKKKVKEQRLSQTEREWYDAVQASLKVFLNASYGVFGSDAFALYTPAVAESVTAIGRDTIKKTLKIAEENGLFILYGDTDSMFVWSPPKEAIDRLVSIIEREFKLDLEMDKVFKYVAFSGLKKNYLGVTQSGEVIIKGLLGKKRNQPEFVKVAFREVIDVFSRINTPEEFERGKQIVIEKLKEVYRKLKLKEYTLDELAFNVMINKPINEYKDVTPQHIKAALMLEMTGRRLSKGDIVSYVKVKGKDGVKPVELAKLSDIDLIKYIETVQSTFEQILESLNVEWKEIEGFAKLESYFF